MQMIESFIIVGMKMKFKNMKIEINEEQDLFDIVDQLEVLGYSGIGGYFGYEEHVITNSDGDYTFRLNSGGEKTATLKELREMK